MTRDMLNCSDVVHWNAKTASKATTDIPAANPVPKRAASMTMQFMKKTSVPHRFNACGRANTSATNWNLKVGDWIASR